MRKIFSLLALSAFIAFNVTAQENKDWDKDRVTVEPSGNIITKDVKVSSFDQLDANGVFSLLLTQGNKEEVKIEADDNLQQYFEVKNEGSTLVIAMKKNLNI